MAHIKTIHDLVGKEVGVTPWIVIDQAKIDNHAQNSGASRVEAAYDAR